MQEQECNRIGYNDTFIGSQSLFILPLDIDHPQGDRPAWFGTEGE